MKNIFRKYSISEACQALAERTRAIRAQTVAVSHAEMVNEGETQLVVGPDTGHFVDSLCWVNQQLELSSHPTLCILRVWNNVHKETASP